MIRTIKANERHFSDFDWLKTYWLFSFDTYYDENNLNFGTLRVFNDDVVEPKTGFPPHFHKEMEIVTIVLDGEVTHQDSMKNKAVIKAGDVQRMSAGTGITHSEYNWGDKPVHFYQIWIYPDQNGLRPSYEQKSFSSLLKKNTLLPVVSGQGFKDVIKMHADSTIYLAEVEKGKSIDFKSDPSRGIFVYITNGDITINGQRFKNNDQARISDESNLRFRTDEDTKLALIDVPIRKD